MKTVAVKKSTSKAKTKTTKTAKVSVQSPSKKQRVSLQNLNLMSAVLFLGLAIAAGVFMKSTTFETTVTHLTANKLDGGVIVAAYRHFVDVDLRWLLVGFLGLSALGPLLHATTMKAKYAASTKAKVMPWRWVEQGVLQALMVSIVALLLGFQDVVGLKLIAVSILVVNLLSWYAEREFLTDVKQAAKSHLFAMILAGLSVLYLGSSLLATYVYGQVRASWYVYAAFSVIVLTLLMQSIKQMKYLRGHKAYKNYDALETRYVALGLVSKLAFAVVLIVGFAK